MTDRELLELAAKAAGMKIHAARQVERDEEGYANCGLWIINDTTGWNPLTDDGDALRLAVKLGLTIDTADGTPDGDIDTPATRVDSGNGRMLLIEVHGANPYAATRRAIVRAAAEIGRNME